MEDLPFQFPRLQRRRATLRRLARLAFGVLCNYQTIGDDRIPSEGPLIVVANHFHFADPVAAITVLPPKTEFIGGAVMPNAPQYLTWIPKLWGFLPVHRGAATGEALKAARGVLARGGILMLFPEAGSWATVLRPARPGAAFLAAETGAPLLPIGLQGLPEIFPRLRRGSRATVTVRVGERFGPFHTTGRGRARRAQLEEIGHDIMRHIAALIPPEKHGVYSTDPALRAAAEEVADYPWD
jgi:1-acyl-sn-glycerol-3-phosphate acyltransferase